MFLVSMLFYKSVIICLFISVIYGWLNIKVEIKRNNEHWKWNVNLEFKEMMLSVSAALSAGYSIENSIRESRKDIELLYGKKSLLLPEVDRMILSVENSIPIEKAISEFASGCDVEDIKCFSDIFCIAQKTGGNMVEIVKSTADKISSKIEVNREIKTMIAAKNECSTAFDNRIFLDNLTRFFGLSLYGGRAYFYDNIVFDIHIRLYAQQ